MVLGRLGIEPCLSAQPIAFRQSEESAQAEVGVGGDSTLACHDIPNALSRYADFFRQPVLRDAQRLEELLQEDFAGVNRGQELFAHGQSPSMIVYDLNVLRVCACPTEAHPELSVDADTILPSTIVLQGFQPVPWWDAQIV